MPCRCVSCDVVAVSCDMSCDIPQELLVKSSGEIDRLQDELDEVNKRYVTMVTLYSIPLPSGLPQPPAAGERSGERVWSSSAEAGACRGITRREGEGTCRGQRKDCQSHR